MEKLTKESAEKEGHTRTKKKKNKNKIAQRSGGRISRRALEMEMSNTKQVYKEDRNGCVHDNREQWQLESNPVYLGKEYQQKIHASDRLSLTCVDCRGTVL